MIRSRLVFIQVAILIFIGCALWYKGGAVRPISWESKHTIDMPADQQAYQQPVVPTLDLVEPEASYGTTPAEDATGIQNGSEPTEIPIDTVTIPDEHHDDEQMPDAAVAPYIEAILNPNSTALPPRLQCSDLSASMERYSYLGASPTPTPELKYFFALDLRQSQAVLPTLLSSVVSAIRFLGPSSCALSIVEGHSSDLTYSILAALLPQLKQDLGLSYYHLASSDLDPATGDRIARLAELRNLALAPLLSAPFSSHSGILNTRRARRSSNSPTDTMPLPGTENTSVVFLNDVSLCPADILELVHQRQFQSAHMTCAMDWTYVGRDPTFYDVWVARTLSGNLFFDIPPDGNWNNAWNVFFADPGTKTRYSRGLPFQVYACWNGAVVFGAKPLLLGNGEGKTKEGGIRFRSSREGECPMGEPTLFCKDMWWEGYGRIAVVPSVNLEYSDEKAADIKALKGGVEGFTDGVMKEEEEERERIYWQEEPPENVICMPGLGDTSWRPWNETMA